MIFDLQKADIWKRISAFILDMIIFVIMATLFVYIISAITHFDRKQDAVNQLLLRYEQEYGYSVSMTQEEYLALPEADQKLYEAEMTALVEDPEYNKRFSELTNLILLMTSIGIFLTYLITEIVIPLIFKDGKTLGKKIFSLGVMQTNGVRLHTVQLVIRTLLGKFSIETMIPVYILILIVFSGIGLIGTIILILIAALQIICICATKTNSAIHDLLANTVVVDYASQMIFDSVEEMKEYKKNYSNGV